MAGMEYTLTGFDDFLERRRVVFVEPLPSTRACKRQIVNGEQKCPIDGREFAEAAVVSINFKQSDLEQHHVFCVVGGRECSFVGRLGDLKEHVAGCSNDKVRCAECQMSVLRSGAVQHCRQCDAKSAPQQIVSTMAIAVAVENIGSMKRDLEKIRQRASSEKVDNDAVVNDANSLMERMTCLERELMQEGKKASGERDLLLPAMKKSVITAGPYRTFSKPGVFMTTWMFPEIYAGYSAVNEGEEEHVLSADSGLLAGYKFRLDCKIQKQENEDVLLNFVLFLGDYDLDNFLEWPFAKKVTVIVWHPRDERKDVRLSVNMEDPQMVKKPAPDSWNCGISTETMTWKDIEFHGFVVNDTVYVNVELE
ncbi:hypothetical protein V5799_018655 [Amblyomma americanum]|uniref:TRAF1-6 MATH domain-containing protein n=1 Tax=Amblyomma americanum TaxID=6943 RepID=A0AAQ4EYW1_AMBAM